MSKDLSTCIIELNKHNVQTHNIFNSQDLPEVVKGA